jgi:elongation factor Ts
MEYSTKDVAKLREITGAGFADCKNALAEAPSFDQAIKVIEAKGQKRAEKVKAAERETREGGIFSYIHHGNNLGVLLELNCSTDFVARSDEFKTLGRELALQIAGTNPKYVSLADVPEDVKAAATKQELEEQVLLEQPSVRDPKVTMGKLVDDVIRKTGENVIVRRFTRYALGG